MFPKRILPMQNSLKFWNDAAGKYARSPIKDMPAYEKTMERTRNYLKNTDDVLELGCGTGSTALLLADAAGRITATDLSPEMIALAKGKLDQSDIENVEFRAASVEDALDNGQEHDVVLAFNLLHLLEDSAGVIARAHQAIRPGGYFISKSVCLPSGTPSFKFGLMRFAIPVMQFFGKAPFVKFMSTSDLDKLVEETGFRIVETGNYPASPPSHFIVAQKC